MLVDAGTGIESEDLWEIKCVEEAKLDWQSVDLVLRTITQRRAALDAEEARWLRQAEAMRIWRPLGMVSALDYMERALGYAPRAAQERLRVARALGSLPLLGAALSCGDLLFSAVRELTRVATPETELAWRDEAVGKNLRQIEALVADRRPGDRPDDPKAPEVRTRVVRFELSAETFALLRQARQALDDAHGSHLSDDEMIAAMCNGTLDGTAGPDADGRAKFQVAVTVCERCRQGWQEGAGASIAIAGAAVERALCDAQHLGSIDGAAPERAYQDIPPSVARFVRRRDGGRCRVPGCRSARGLELHHIVRRADGGSHDALNVVILCSACHQSHHDGVLAISGTADRLEVRRPGACRSAETGGTKDGAHVGARGGEAPIVDDARKALVGLGWNQGIAAAAVTAAAAMAANATLEQLIFEALKRCPQPRG
jgi:RuvA, C-terminal domain/HNH endonuclease